MQSWLRRLIIRIPFRRLQVACDTVVDGRITSLKQIRSKFNTRHFFFFEILEFHFFSFFLEFLRPERFRKLREACRIHFHLVAPNKFFMVPSYDQKTKKVNEY